MRVLLTGGSGFIGRHVLPLLLERGHKVLAVERNRRLPKAKNLKTVRGDVRRAVLAFKPQACLHLAWDGIGDYSFERCAQNLDEGLRLVALLREAMCPKLVAAGSCWEYGVSRGVCRESAWPKTVSDFTWAKNALHAYARLVLPRVLWCRVFFVYGPGQRAAALIPSLFRAKAEGRIPDVKNPQDAQDFIHVSDVAAGLVRALERNAPGGSYNLGTGRAVRVGEVARLATGTVPMRRRNERPGPPAVFWAGTSLARRRLSWKARVSLKTGLTRV
ncbi:MAG: NAD(P)-dependent oxidoreductase [Elusimicrobia bacterium]|nr:NAD(P)-dependent oxidoreductase [Elusimicrobiota bacterium]